MNNYILLIRELPNKFQAALFGNYDSYDINGRHTLILLNVKIVKIINFLIVISRFLERTLFSFIQLCYEEETRKKSLLRALREQVDLMFFIFY